MEIEQVIDHIQNRAYMSGVERDKARVKATGEVFTPDSLANEVLESTIDHMNDDEKKNFVNSSWVDPACGDGSLLGAVVIAKMRHGATFIQAIETVKGYDIEQSNVDEAIRRLSCGNGQAEQILKSRIIRQNAGTICNNNFNNLFDVG